MTNGDGLEDSRVTGPEIKTMTAAEITGLVNLFNSMMVSMEGRLIAKLDENSRGASERWIKHEKESTERWSKHEHELEVNTLRVVTRFEKMESAMLVVEKALEAHLDRERDDHLIMDARVRPVKTLAEWISKNWKTIALVIALITTTILAWVEGIEHTISSLLP